MGTFWKCVLVKFVLTKDLVYQTFLCIVPMATLGLKEVGKFLGEGRGKNAQGRPLNILFNLNLKNQRKDGFWLLTGHLLSSTDFVYILIFKIQFRAASCIQTDMFHRNINGKRDAESLEVNSKIILPHNALDIMIYTYATRLASEASCVKMRSLNLM